MKSTRGIAQLAVVAIVAGVVLVAGVVIRAPKGKGAVWYAPHTWFSHKPAEKADKAQAAVAAAQDRTQVATAAAVHAATVEAHKTVVGASHLAAAPESALVQRTAGNTFGILNELSPLSAAEMQENNAVILGLLSAETTRREAAEAAQARAEAKAGAAMEATQKAKAAEVKAEGQLTAAQAQLRSAFEDRNAKANELEALTARHWIALVLAVLLLGGAVYLRFVVGSVGRALHFLEPALGPQQYNTVVSQLDSEMGALGQWFVRSGKAKAAHAAAKAKALLSGAVDAGPNKGNPPANS